MLLWQTDLYGCLVRSVVMVAYYMDTSLAVVGMYDAATLQTTLNTHRQWTSPFGCCYSQAIVHRSILFALWHHTAGTLYKCYWWIINCFRPDHSPYCLLKLIWQELPRCNKFLLGSRQFPRLGQIGVEGHLLPCAPPPVATLLLPSGACAEIASDLILNTIL